MHYSVFVCQTDLKICIYPTVYLPKVKEKSKTFVQHSVSLYDKFLSPHLLLLQQAKISKSRNPPKTKIYL